MTDAATQARRPAPTVPGQHNAVAIHVEEGSSTTAAKIIPLQLEPENDRPHTKPQRVKLLCLDISNCSTYSQLGILSFGVCLFFILCGLVEEYTFRQLPKFEYGIYLTFFELLSFAIFGALERVAQGERVFAYNAPPWRHAIVAVAMTAARGLTNVSLQYLEYPTQVIFKSMKLITVMVGSVFILRKSYSFLEYVAAAFLVSSSVFFSLGDHEGSALIEPVGLVIVIVSLVADAFHSTTQEAVLRGCNATLLETMLFTNLLASIFTLIYCVLSGELWLALDYCAKYPIAYALFLFRSFIIYCGVLFYLTLVKRFDAVLATTVTTVRKILTVMFSFFFFPKPFSIKHLYGLIAFLVGVYINMREMKH